MDIEDFFFLVVDNNNTRNGTVPRTIKPIVPVRIFLYTGLFLTCLMSVIFSYAFCVCDKERRKKIRYKFSQSIGFVMMLSVLIIFGHCVQSIVAALPSLLPQMGADHRFPLCATVAVISHCVSLFMIQSYFFLAFLIMLSSLCYYRNTSGSNNLLGPLMGRLLGCCSCGCCSQYDNIFHPAWDKCPTVCNSGRVTLFCKVVCLIVFYSIGFIVQLIPLMSNLLSDGKLEKFEAVGYFCQFHDDKDLFSYYFIVAIFTLLVFTIIAIVKSLVDCYYYVMHDKRVRMLDLNPSSKGNAMIEEPSINTADGDGTEGGATFSEKSYLITQGKTKTGKRKKRRISAEESDYAINSAREAKEQMSEAIEKATENLVVSVVLILFFVLRFPLAVYFWYAVKKKPDPELTSEALYRLFVWNWHGFVVVSFLAILAFIHQRYILPRIRKYYGYEDADSP